MNAYVGCLTDPQLDFLDGQRHSLSTLPLDDTLALCVSKGMTLLYQDQVFSPALFPGAPRTVFRCHDTWCSPEPPAEHKSLIEETAMQLHAEQTVVIGQKVVLIANFRCVFSGGAKSG